MDHQPTVKTGSLRLVTAAPLPANWREPGAMPVAGPPAAAVTVGSEFAAAMVEFMKSPRVPRGLFPTNPLVCDVPVVYIAPRARCQPAARSCFRVAPSSVRSTPRPSDESTLRVPGGEPGL